MYCIIPFNSYIFALPNRELEIESPKNKEDMKKIIIALSTVLGSMAGVAAADYPEMNIETAVNQGPQFVQKSEIIHTIKEKEQIRIKVDYIVDESGKNYVVYIQSNRPDIHDRIIRMVESMPAQQGTEFKKNNIVIEYEL
jgi:hypothetical protein